jgi:hypothetical protein
MNRSPQPAKKQKALLGDFLLYCLNLGEIPFYHRFFP